MVCKKICIILERADIALGGAERSAFELAAALKALGHQVHIIAANAPTGLTKTDDIIMLCNEPSGKRSCFWSFKKALQEHLANHHYDIIHSFLPFCFADIYQPRGGAYPEAIARNADSFSNTIIQYYKKITAPLNLRRTVLSLAEKHLCKKGNGPVVVALSSYVAQQFKDHYKLSENRIIIIPNGIIADSSIEKEVSDNLRKKIFNKFRLAASDKAIFFLFAANNFRLKGLHALLSAFEQATRQQPAKRAYLLIAGSDKPFKYQLIAKKLKIDDKIIFLGTVNKIQNALAIADVAVLPTYYDPSSRFILEALALSKPVITTRFNGAADLFTNGRGGIIIDRPENTNALSDAITFFLDTSNIERARKAIIDDKIIDNISISRVAKQLDRLYEKIIAQRGEK